MESVVQSPCVRNCCLNEEDICLGCFRSLAEITRWGAVNNQIKLEIVRNAEQRRVDYLKKWRR
ncbi:DUF1289 domain-containing protein [Cellvibrio mixtus]|uniref:DUF1289 domain-containing protein n=1 Tax=Cellvibrio mixtus TaxID=39650 RepID=UPI0022868426|nr:DUF1289 domain-containing protein [Cellvibrio mixtus]